MRRPEPTDVCLPQAHVSTTGHGWQKARRFEGHYDAQHGLRSQAKVGSNLGSVTF